MNSVPKSLRVWFIVHFFADMFFAIPLIFFTAWTLSLLNFPSDNLLFARLVGAALVEIGTTSLLVHNAGAETYLALLKLKLLWSGSAILAIIISLFENPPKITWVLLAIFLIFFIVWLTYYFKLRTIQSKLLVYND